MEIAQGVLLSMFFSDTSKPFLGKGQYQPKWKQKPWKKKEEPSKRINEDFTSKLNSMRVTDFARFVPTLIAYLAAQTSCFKSSRLAQFIPAWQQITSDTEILQMVLCQYILNSVPSLLRNILHQGNALVGKKKLLLPLKLPAYSRKHS